MLKSIIIDNNNSNTSSNGRIQILKLSFTKYRYHDPCTATKGFHLPRASGGRGIPSVVNVSCKQIVNLQNYFLDGIEESSMHRKVAEMNRGLRPLHLLGRHYDPSQHIRTKNRLIEH